MDAREMKKQILFDALDKYDRNLIDPMEMHRLDRIRSTVARITDRNVDQVTNGQIQRFRKVLRQMLENAESKI
jgi:hypothetical protein